MFVGERLVGFIGNIAHKPDLGGKVPGTNSGDATDLFQEGLLIPPLKILRRGEINADVEAIICANTRTPEVTWGDIKAQVNTNTYGLSKFAELFGKYGIDNVLACWQRWMDICEAELRKEIAKVPDGLYGPETDCLDDDGVELAKPHRISASLEVKGDTLHFILDSDAQARGPDQPAALRLAQLHRMPGEDDLHSGPAGERRPVAAGARVLSAGRLAAQSALSRAGEHVCAPEPGHDLGHHARARAGRARAACRRRAAPPAARCRARAAIPRSGRWYSQYEILNGGTGARPDGDGVSAMDELVVNVMNTPVEAIESEFPVRVERYELAADSGGAGQFPRRPRRAPAVAHPGRRNQRQSAHGPVQVLLPRRVRRQAGARLQGGAQSRRRRRSAR